MINRVSEKQILGKLKLYLTSLEHKVQISWPIGKCRTGNFTRNEKVLFVLRPTVGPSLICN